MSCSFCETSAEIKKRVIGENDLAYAFLTQTPITHGHFLVVPKKCVATFGELNEKEIYAIFSLMESLKQVFGEKNAYTEFNHAWNQGENAGQTVDHFHLHVVPRTKNDDGVQKEDVRKYLYRPGERSVEDSERIYEIAQNIRK